MFGVWIFYQCGYQRFNKHMSRWD